MRAAAFTVPGPPEVLSIHELPDPQAGPGEVRVRVLAAGVQPYDAAVRAGWEPPGVTLGDPRVPGNEFAGVTDDGREVLGFCTLGAYAEYVVVPANQVTAKPDAMSWHVAGGFSAGAQTAHISLDVLGVGPDDRLVIHGAAGSVGTMAVQLAGLAGATVIATGSAANQDYLRSLGAIPVVYGDGLTERLRDHKPTAAIDAVGGDALQASIDLIDDRSRILTLFEYERADDLGVKVPVPGRSAERLAGLANLYAEGKLSCHVRRTVPLADAADAHREIETRHGRGKIVLTLE